MKTERFRCHKKLANCTLVGLFTQKERECARVTKQRDCTWLCNSHFFELRIDFNLFMKLYTFDCEYFFLDTMDRQSASCNARQRISEIITLPRKMTACNYFKTHFYVYRPNFLGENNDSDNLTQERAPLITIIRSKRFKLRYMLLDIFFLFKWKRN